MRGRKGEKVVHGFEHAPFEPEIGVVELATTASGEVPVVVINSEQPHRSALAAIKAWRGHRLALPLPILAMVDLVKENPLGAIGGSIAALVMATGSVAVVADPSILQQVRHPTVVTVTAPPMPAVTVTRYVTVRPVAPGGALLHVHTFSPRPSPAPPVVGSPSPSPTPIPQITQQPEPSSVTLEPAIIPPAPSEPGPSGEAEADAQPLVDQTQPGLCAPPGGCPTG